MPELPEIANMAENLQKYLPGYYILKLNYDLDSKQVLPLKSLKLPIKILGITIRGKKLIFILENNFFIVSSLSLTGHWSWNKTDNSRIWFDLSDGVNKVGTIYFDDPRRFAIFEVFDSIQKLNNSFKNKVGPDLLSENISFEKWLETVNYKKMVCDFLIEQKHISGIGNIYRSEIAYHAKINPTRLMSSLNKNELKTLYESSIYVLRKAYNEGGSKRYINPLGKGGKYDPLVYKKEIDLFGNKINVENCKGRKIFWVPEIQK